MASDPNKPFRDLFGRFRPSPGKINNPNVVDTSNVRASESRSIINRPGEFANRDPQIDPAAARIAARTLANRMDIITKAPGHKLANESDEAREARIDRIAQRFMEDGTGDGIQDVLRMSPEEIQSYARRQQEGINTPGVPPVRY